jgi:hypothetical protein
MISHFPRKTLKTIKIMRIIHSMIHHKFMDKMAIMLLKKNIEFSKDRKEQEKI